MFPASSNQAMPNGTNSFLLPSFFAQDGVNDKAAPNVDTGLAAVVQEDFVRAAGLFEGVAQDWHRVELLFSVDRPNECDHLGC